MNIITKHILKKRHIPAAKHDERFQDVVYIIEANEFALHHLWKLYSTESAAMSFGFKHVHKNQKHVFVQDSRCFSFTVGSIGGLPIHVLFSFYMFDGFRVVFYDNQGMAFHHGKVKDWLKENVPIKAGGTRFAHCDAMNFGICLAHIDNLRIERRRLENLK